MSTTTKPAPATTAGYRDARIPPFSYVTHAAMAALHGEFGPDDQRDLAMAMYLSLAVMASEARARGNHGEFEATRSEIAEHCGLSAKTVERLSPRFERAQLLVLEHRPGRSSLWLLVDPQAPQVASPSRDPATGSRDLPPTGSRDPASPSRDTPDSESRPLVNARAGSDEEGKNEESPPPPEGERTPIEDLDRPIGNRRRDWQRYGRQLKESAGTCCVEAGSAPTTAEAEWARLAPEVRKVVGPDTFDVWFASAHAHADGDGTFLLAVPEVAYGWIRDRFARALNQVAERPLEIVVCEETS